MYEGNDLNQNLILENRNVVYLHCVQAKSMHVRWAIAVATIKLGPAWAKNSVRGC